MFSRKPDPPTPRHPTHSLTIRVVKLIEIDAQGLGIVAAPITAFLVVAILAIIVMFGGGSMLSTIGSIISRQAEEVVASPPDRPPPAPTIIAP